MKLKVNVKVIGELRTGTSKSTGNPWKSQNLVLETLDQEGTQRFSVVAFGDSCDELLREGVRVGDCLLVSLWFNTSSARSGYIYNEIKLLTFERAGEGGAQ